MLATAVSMSRSSVTAYYHFPLQHSLNQQQLPALSTTGHESNCQRMFLSSSHGSHGNDDSSEFILKKSQECSSKTEVLRLAYACATRQVRPAPSDKALRLLSLLRQVEPVVSATKQGRLNRSRSWLGPALCTERFSSVVDHYHMDRVIASQTNKQTNKQYVPEHAKAANDRAGTGAGRG